MSKKFDTWELVSTALDISPRVLLWGPPGLGKTYTALKHPGNHSKVYSVTVTEETPAAEIRGHFIPKGTEFIWHDGPAIRAWREGARLVINEIGEASADLLTFLHAICDDPEFAELTLPTGETVKPAENFQVVGTTNETPETLSPALRDRFLPTIKIDRPPKEALDMFGDLRSVVEATTSPEWTGEADGKSLTLRQWIAYTTFSEKVAPELAGVLAFGDQTAEALTDAMQIGAVETSDTWTKEHMVEGANLGSVPILETPATVEAMAEATAEILNDPLAETTAEIITEANRKIAEAAALPTIPIHETGLAHPHTRTERYQQLLDEGMTDEVANHMVKQEFGDA